MNIKHLFLPLLTSSTLLFATLSYAGTVFQITFISNNNSPDGYPLVYGSFSSASSNYTFKPDPVDARIVSIFSNLGKNTPLAMAGTITLVYPSNPGVTCTFSVSVGGDGEAPGKGPLFKIERHADCENNKIEMGPYSAGGGNWNVYNSAHYSVPLSFKQPYEGSGSR